MTKQAEILKIISNTWVKYPELRFGQLLTGLNVLTFTNKFDPSVFNYTLRDIFADSDESILKRIKNSSIAVYDKDEE